MLDAFYWLEIPGAYYAIVIALPDQYIQLGFIRGVLDSEYDTTTV